MKTLKKLGVLVMSVVMMLTVLMIPSQAAVIADRYSVLVLDCSGSMYGAPLEEMKDAAVAFCNQVLDSRRGNNKIAIVKFESYSSVVIDFTDDKDSLVTAIESLYDGNMTALGEGIRDANELLAKVDDSAIKNMLVMCDGYPNQGVNYLTALYEVPLNVNIYGLYFAQDGYSSSAAKVMQTVGRNGSWEVEDGSELIYTFVNDWGSTVTNNSVTNTVITIACPVDVSVTLNGETLNRYNPRTSFGKLEFSGDADDEVKTLTLSYRNDYVIEITGTGEGTMDYSIAYYCADELLYDMSYPTIDIYSTSKITTGVDVNNSSMPLMVDNDGDNNVDDEVAPKASASNWLYRIRDFFVELYYKFIEFFSNIFTF